MADKYVPSSLGVVVGCGSSRLRPLPPAGSVQSARAFGPHVGEQQDVADRRRAREQHHQPVDADTQAPGRRQADLECADVVRIIMHGLVVASGLGLDLGTDACGLVLGIVELREPVRHLLAADEQLRSEEHTSELQSLMRISYAVFCLKKKKKTATVKHYDINRTET